MTCITDRHTTCLTCTDGTCHTVVERLRRMRSSVLIMRMRPGHLRITAVERLRRVVAMMAVMMVGHIRIYIRLIVIQIDGFRLGVIRRPITIVIRRTPNRITRTAVHFPQRRTLNKDRTDDVVISVQIRITYHFHVQHVSTTFCNKRCNVLEIAGAQACLTE